MRDRGKSGQETATRVGDERLGTVESHLVAGAADDVGDVHERSARWIECHRGRVGSEAHPDRLDALELADGARDSRRA